MKRKTTEQFKKEVHDLVGDEYTVLGEYVKNSEKILMQHNSKTCNNNKYFARPTDILDGCKCPVCNVIKSRKTTEQFKKDVYNLVGDEYTVLGEYVKNKEKIDMIHNTCKNIISITPNKFISGGNRCPICFSKKRLEAATRNRKTTEQFKKEVYNLVGDEYTVLGEYVSGKKHIKMLHEKCGYEFSMAPYCFLGLKQRCPKCFGHPRKTTEQFKKEVYNLVGDEYTVLGEYVNSRTHIKMIHNVCKNIYNVSPDKFLSGRRCPNCAKHATTSKKEKEVFSIINDDSTKLNVKFDRKEIDIFIENLKLGIEFDGLYWHSTARNDNKHNLLEKTEFFKSKNIPVIHIFEDEWDNQQDAVKDRISNIILNNTQYIQNPSNSGQLIPFTNETQPNQIIIDRRWFITDKDILAAGYHLKETLPPKEFFLTNSCDIRHTEKSEDTRFSIFDCGYLVYEK